jgi:hypothetical protein
MTYKLVTPGLVTTLKNALGPFEQTLDWKQQQTSVDSSGRPREVYVDMVAAITATISETTFDETSAFSQPGHQVNYKISSFGSPPAGIKPGDALAYKGQFFYIVAIDDTGRLGLATTYYTHIIPGR